MNLPKRKSTRVPQYNYANNGYYFVTICTHNKNHLFGDVNNLNEKGKIVKTELEDISMHFEHVKIDKYVIMPNHLHCIVMIGCDRAPYSNVGEGLDPPAVVSLNIIIGLFKSGVSKRIYELYPKIPVWQRSFYEHIIRNEDDYLRIWKYIDENPAKWIEDEYFVEM